VQGAKVQKKVTNSYGYGMVSTICCCVNLTYRQAPGVSDKTREAKTWKKSGRRGEATQWNVPYRMHIGRASTGYKDERVRSAKAYLSRPFG
jgi:hypothetical protein